MEWLNEPASWQRTGDVLTVSVDPSTDFWRETGYGYIRDSGHVYGEVLAGDLDVSVRMRCTLGVQYDQAGVMLRADERTWLKTGVEFFEGRARLSTVLTLGRSSWMVTDLPAGTDEIVLRVSRRGDAVEVRYVLEDGPAELAALVFMPPGREVLAGVMAAAPEGPGFRVTFHDLRITERDWSGAAGDDPAWSDDQARWSGDAAPAWSPADGEAGWPAPETGEDAPGWPATTGEEPPAWPVPAAEAEAEEPRWQVPAAGDDDPRWSVPAAQEDDPGWRATAGGADDPGWAASEDDEAGWVAALAAADGDDELGWAVAPVAAGAGDLERAGVDEPAVADSSEPAGAAPAETGPAGAGTAEAGANETGANETGPAGAGTAETGPAGAAANETGAAGAGTGAAGARPAEAEPAGAESIAAVPAGPAPVRPDPADAEHVRDEPAGPETVAEEPPAQEPAEKNGDGEPWSPAPLADHVGWARPASDNGAAGVDPAADWERLAAGAQASAQAQAAGAQAARWRAQTDADVANEWPGPPLRTAMRNGLLAGDAGLRPAVNEYVDEAQTDPGLTRPRQATEEPGWAKVSTAPAEASTAPASTAPAEASTAPAEASTAPADVSTGPSEAGRPEPAPSAREARRARSRRAAADVPAEPDAADEWISLLTADPVEE
jgi:regulation of enolase protein 1 (concanavalin A-like superfamily)